jgi:uncharacterized protein
MRMKKIFILIVVLLIVPLVFGKEYQIPLLAVKDTPEGFKGSTAKMFLEVQGGKGRVFLDTYPLTKLDTQMATRFAKEVACSESSFGCDKYDFIYTIKSSSVIVGGPSAGAATALLTFAALENLEIEKGVSITGTINSGGLIGTVGGLKEKISAASDLGLKKVLIPHGEKIGEIKGVVLENYTINVSTDNVSTIDLIKYGESLGIEVIEVFTIEEALYHATGKQILRWNKSLKIDEEYEKTMRIVTQELCDDTLKFKKDLEKYEFEGEDKVIFDIALNLTEKHEKSLSNKKYYSAASFCFGANTKFAYLTLKKKGWNNNHLLTKATELKTQIKEVEEIIEGKEIKTITDLETYMIVKERLLEAEESVGKVIKSNNKTEKLNYMAYSIERLKSAISWSSFFDKGGKEFIMNKEELKNSCVDKINEAEERYSYLVLMTSTSFESTKLEIELAKKDLENENYELCLFKASKAKANSDVILNTVGIEESQLSDVNKKRLDVIEQIIIKEQEKGIFPVVGYSYYEYANELKEDDLFSSMLFAEYALELSNLDIYFKEEVYNFDLRIEDNLIISFSLIFIIGIFIGIFIGRSNNKKVKIRHGKVIIKPRRPPKRRSGKKR